MSRLRSLLGATRSVARSGAGSLRVVTALGWTILGLAASAWLIGTRFGWRELLIIAATGVILLAVAGLSTLGKLDLSSRLDVEPARVVVGERAAGSMTMHNRSSRHSRAVRVELPVGSSSALFDVPRLASQAEHDELFVVPTSRRAVIPVGPVTTVQGDALGIFRRTRTWSDRYEIFVHPKTVLLETMAAGLVRDLEGQTTNHLTNSDVAFHTLRDYVPGDDRRHVHWKTSAKLDKLMVRQYVDTRRSHVCVLLSIDSAEFGDEDEFEIAVSSAASVAMQAFRDEQTLTVIIGGIQLPVINPREMLDQFSRIVWRTESNGSTESSGGNGGIDSCFTTARRVANEASVTTVSVGRTPPIPDIRRAATRASLETRVIVLQANLEADNGYRAIGSTYFVHLNSLDGLRRGLTAVM